MRQYYFYKLGEQNKFLVQGVYDKQVFNNYWHCRFIQTVCSGRRVSGNGVSLQKIVWCKCRQHSWFSVPVLFVWFWLVKLFWFVFKCRFVRFWLGCKGCRQSYSNVLVMVRWFSFVTGLLVRHLGFCLLWYKVKLVINVLVSAKHKLFCCSAWSSLVIVFHCWLGKRFFVFNRQATKKQKLTSNSKPTASSTRS